jgi:thiamine-monophosphate kinase
VSRSAFVADLGEFGLIARLARAVGATASPALTPGLKRGIGDDAAVWAPTPGTWSVITTDALVENVHFRLSTTDWYDLGWKSLAVNLSDVAAMGAQPRYAVVTIGLAGDLPLAAIDAFYQGMADLAARHDTLLVGGDTVRAPCLAITVTVVGETRPAAPGEAPPLLERRTGRPGDALAVTGALGASAGGLRLLEQLAAAGDRSGDGDGEAAAAPRAPAGGDGERQASAAQRAPDDGDADREALRLAHRRPNPRVAEAAILVNCGLRCGMDLSDGLLSDAERLAEASDVGVVVEAARVPLPAALVAVFGDAAPAMAVAGGEDYELLCAGPPETVAAAAAALAAGGGPALTVVGRLVPRPADGPRVRVVDATGAPLILQQGWTHFATADPGRAPNGERAD